MAAEQLSAAATLAALATDTRRERRTRLTGHQVDDRRQGGQLNGDQDVGEIAGRHRREVLGREGGALGRQERAAGREAHLEDEDQWEHEE